MLMKKLRVVFLVVMMCAFTGCGQNESVEIEEYSISFEDNEIDDSTLEDAWEDMTETEDNEDSALDEEAASKLKAMFGEACIAEQTFEVELSGYDGKVYVVPYLPTEEVPKFHIQIMQDGEVLAKLIEYLPEELEGNTFTSLDAVSFFDINFDDCTDIVTVSTYGDVSCAMIYYGFAKDADEYDRYFIYAYGLSDWIAANLENITISEIRSFVTQGKKNGEFTNYQEAYEARIHLSELENDSEMTYDLIYFDEDDVPELVAGVDGYRVSLYTYRDGRLYTLMNEWAYGAGGNPGYEYAPKKNSLRNYNADFAGLVMYTMYMSINEQFKMETNALIETYNFDDANGNGMPDEEEGASAGNYSVSYMDGVEVTSDEWASYDMGEYEFICGDMSQEEILSLLNQ